MKKTFALLTVLLMAVAVSGCGKVKETDGTTSSAQTAAATAAATSAANTAANSETAGKTDVDFETDAEYVIFNASPDFKLESDAWLGVIPTGVIYKDEADADEQDIIYAYCDNLDENGAKNYRFAFDKDGFYGIEDGVYDMVLCSSDDAETGKVLLQIGLEKKGEKIVLDYENKK